MRKTKEDTEISKLRILIAAENEFCQHGFGSSNMDNIARNAGLTKGAIFWHFQSKAGLFKAAIKRAVERLDCIFDETFLNNRSLPVMEKWRELIKRVKKDRAFEILILLDGAQESSDFPKGLLDECFKDISGTFKTYLKRLEDLKEQNELKSDTDVRAIMLTLTLIMMGLANIRKIKYLISPISGYNDEDAVINAVFNGLLSFQTGTK